MRRSVAAYSMVAILALGLGACTTGDDESQPQTGPDPTTVPAPVETIPADDDATGTTGEPATRPTATGEQSEETTSPDEPTASDVVPELSVEVVTDGLALPWDVQLLPDGTPLVGERGGRLLTLADGEAREVAVELEDFFTGSEAGLMGLAVSPDFEQDRRVLACHATASGGPPQDVRVVSLSLSDDLTSAQVDRVVVEGLPITSGRHSGCRLLLTDDGTLLIGTGDAADPATPQDLQSLGGKVLAVRTDGSPLPEAPFVDGADPRVLTYGHRNVQGLAVRPGTDQVWAVEHGPDVDDEVNLIEPGGNYGWDPGTGYDEGVPMTDLDAFPDAVESVWSSGSPTHATSGAVFLEGSHWGAWDGALAVAELKGSGVTVLVLDGDRVAEQVRVPELDGTYGRLRSLTLDDDGALWVTTSNGDGDLVLRVTAQASPGRR